MEFGVKNLKIKIFIVTAIIFIIGNLLIINWGHNTRTRFYFENTRLEYDSQVDNTIKFIDSKDNYLTVEVEEFSEDHKFLAKNYKVTYKDIIIEADSSKFEEEGLIITDRDGGKHIHPYNDLYYRDIGSIDSGYLEDFSQDVKMIFSIERIYKYLHNNSIDEMMVTSTIMNFIGLGFIVFSKNFTRLLGLTKIIREDVISGAFAFAGLLLVIVAFFRNMLYGIFI